MSTPGDFDVRVEETPGGKVVVHVVGELDLATVSVLQDALDGQRRPSHLVIDLSGCSFLDSSGVRLIVTTAKRTGDAGGELDLVATSDSGVARVLEITGIDTLVRVHPTLESL